MHSQTLNKGLGGERWRDRYCVRNRMSMYTLFGSGEEWVFWYAGDTYSKYTIPELLKTQLKNQI